MIRVFFNEDGYYVAGESIEVTRKCSPALTSRGDRIFLPLHHEYKVLYLALCELRNAQITDDVMVYGSSRIIEEMNGTRPLDETNGRWLMILKRNVLPVIKAVVFFRKKEPAAVQKALNEAQAKFLPQVDRRTLEQIAEAEDAAQATLVKDKKNKLVDSLRCRWFGGNKDGK